MAAMTQKERRRLKRQKQNPNDRRYIYTLTDPRDEAIRYVGQTGQPTERLKWHIADSRLYPHCGRKAAWINELVALKMIPTLSVIEECSKEDVSAREKHWISHYELTCNLLNGNLLTRKLAAPPLGVAEPSKKHGGKRVRLNQKEA